MNEFAEETFSPSHHHPSLDIPSKIINQIETGNLFIPQQQKPLIKPIQYQSLGELDNKNKVMIDKIRQNKNKTLIQLTELQKKQQQLKQAIREMNRSRIKSKKDRSSFTQQEKNKIKNIYKQMKIDQVLKKKKHQMVLQSFTNILKKQKQDDLELVQKLRLQHRKAVQHNLLSMQLRKKKRQQSVKDMSKRMLQLKQKKYIHLLNMKADVQQKQKQQQFRQQKLQSIKQRFRLDFNEIKQHQQKHKKIIQLQTQKRKERYKTETVKNSTSRKYSRNLFSRILQQQQKQKSLEKAKKQNRAKQLRWKIDQFKSLVKQKYMPKQKSLSHSQEKQKSPSLEQRKVHALSYKQRFDQGNQYLKLAKKLRKQKDDPKLVTEPNLIKYVDYLKTINKKSKKSGTLQQFKSMINTQQSMDYSSATKAKKLVDQIQAKSKKTRDNKLLQSIQNKIDLLKVLL